MRGTPFKGRSNFKGPSNEKMPGHKNQRPHERTKEVRVYGRHACESCFAKRPQDIKRAFFLKSIAPDFSAVMQYCTKMKLPYRIVPEEELHRVAQTEHHEGVCFITEPPTFMDLPRWLRCHKESLHLLVLVLVDVGNPHNLGAIVRSAAHFGTSAVILTHPLSAVTGAGGRVAQGGGEQIDLVPLEDVTHTCAMLREARFSLIGTSRGGSKSLYDYDLSKRTALFIGSEGTGLPPALEASLESSLLIPGTGMVESLNVASATAVLLSEWRRQLL